MKINAVFYLGISAIVFLAHAITQNLSSSEEPIRHVFCYNGIEREYYVRLPKDYDIDQTYWALVAAHGGGSNGRTFWLANDLRRAADKMGLKVATRRAPNPMRPS